MNARAALVFLLLVLQGVPEEKGAVGGIVLSAADGAPIVDAVVFLSAMSQAAPELPPVWTQTIPAVISDRDGGFLFKDLEAGTYRLSFGSNGYVRQEYGQRVFPGNGMPLQVAAGQKMTDLVVRLTPTGTVSGRVRDGDTLPLANVPVRLLRPMYDDDGKRILREFASARTDDRGNYRLHSLTPGRYYLNMGTPSGELPQASTWRPNQVPETFGYAYYPGVT